jgi:hypothetical protein
VVIVIAVWLLPIVFMLWILHEIIEHAVRNGTRRALRDHEMWLRGPGRREDV